uniref:NADH dehydrogenase subunit 6 n=2 Tax=Lepeophtheirus salmonis TaxID=72036 RepID=A0A1M4NER5_LEPSM|nr:NADH dehydrogenase subunit 6 [Lepeophtheirus salmonis]CAH1385111.1 NADH dehydrogenase subunit 6 [Lepeophtheirus salmonis]SFW10612.1 NADH dehydrogenase subunit 6 [Lepeophtheirus salmonis]
MSFEEIFFKLMVISSVACTMILGLIPSPFMLCLLIVVLTSVSCGMVSIFCSQWLSYALVIVFLGGMMVLFTYASSMSVSDKLTKSSSWKMLFVFLIMGLTSSAPSGFKVYMGSLYSNNGGVMLSILTFYLLLCLFSVVKMVEVSKGALIS